MVNIRCYALRSCCGEMRREHVWCEETEMKSCNTTPFYPSRIPDSRITAMGSCVGHQVVVAVVEPKLE